MPNTHSRLGNSVDHGGGWLPTVEPPAMQSISRSDADGADISIGPEWQWINVDVDRRRSQGDESLRPKRKLLWAGLTAVLAATGAGIWVGLAGADYSPVEGIPTQTAAAHSSTKHPVTGACTGLSGTVVTNAAGDTTTAAGVIAAFEYAYYVRRDVEYALALVTPEAALVPEALAAGIASIPLGATHCVAITPVVDSATAEVHLAQQHPDGTRLDYLQLINVRIHEGRAVITNIQKRG